MEFAKIKSKYYCGADLHSKTTYIKIMNGEGDILFNRNLPNNFAVFKSSVQSFLTDLVVGAESTYSYYWLYEGCRRAGIPFYLGHSLYMKAISGNRICPYLFFINIISNMKRVTRIVLNIFLPLFSFTFA